MTTLGKFLSFFIAVIILNMGYFYIFSDVETWLQVRWMQSTADASQIALPHFIYRFVGLVQIITSTLFIASLIFPLCEKKGPLETQGQQNVLIVFAVLLTLTICYHTFRGELEELLRNVIYLVMVGIQLRSLTKKPTNEKVNT